MAAPDQRQSALLRPYATSGQAVRRARKLRRARVPVGTTAVAIMLTEPNSFTRLQVLARAHSWLSLQPLAKGEDTTKHLRHAPDLYL
eukprot:scaffold568_cov376-Prasinococcus_capsulatus_cf.AAC.10